MTNTARAFITPKLMKWARERNKATHESIGVRLNINPAEIISWERGEQYPTLRQAHELAKFLNIPFGYLYLSSPPAEKTPIPDLRTVGNKRPKKLTTEFRDVLNDVILKQQWYKEYLHDQGRPRLEFIGKFSMEDDIKEIASDVEGTLGVNDALRDDNNSWEDYFTAIVRRCEAIGILVLRNSIVANNTHRPLSVREFRGFVIADDLAPMVFINTQDSKTAQIFTLIHEVVHLWLGKSGISNAALKTAINDPTNRLEKFCNRIAAEVLIPEEGFNQNWDGNFEIDQNLQRLSRRYKVSKSVVLRRAYEMEVIGYAEYARLLRREELHWNRINKAKKGDGANFQYLLMARNSSTLTKAVISEALEGNMPSREAGRLLGISDLDALNRVGEKIFGTA